jgi:hypothetical protein
LYRPPVQTAPTPGATIAPEPEVDLTMATTTRARLDACVDRRVGLTLRDGTRLDDCRVAAISNGRLVTTARIILGKVEVFLPVESIDDVWEI